MKPTWLKNAEMEMTFIGEITVWKYVDEDGNPRRCLTAIEGLPLTMKKPRKLKDPR